MSTIIKHKEFTNHKVYKTEVAGRPLTIDVGKVAELATASAMVTYGETTVSICIVTLSSVMTGWGGKSATCSLSETTLATRSMKGSLKCRPTFQVVL